MCDFECVEANETKKKIDFDDINKKKGVMNILINQRHRVSITLITSFYFILTRLHHRNIEYQLIIKLLLSSRWKEMLRLFKKKKIYTLSMLSCKNVFFSYCFKRFLKCHKCLNAFIDTNKIEIIKLPRIVFFFFCVIDIELSTHGIIYNNHLWTKLCVEKVL